MDEFEFEFRAEEEAVLADLDRLRPDRYASLDWANPAMTKLRTLYTSDLDYLEALAEDHARAVISAHERRSMNTVSRAIDRIVSGNALTLAFDDCAHMPLKVGEEKVSLRSMSSGDWRTWADEKESVAMRNHAAELARCTVARQIADMLDNRGVYRTDELPRDEAA